MKLSAKFLVFASFLMLNCLSIFAQNTEKFSSPEELSIKDQQLLLSLPDLELKSGYKSPLPYKVDNSTSPNWRPVFQQSGMSCGQASSTGMCFTYEMNAARNLPANNNNNLYPTGFVYNWAAGDWGSSGVSYYHTFEVLRTVGTPNQAEYGGTIDYGGNLRWITGYNLYYSAMHNRIKNAYKINVSTPEGLQLLKQWLYDHARGDEKGGAAVFYSTVPYPNATLPVGTEEGGKFVLTELTASTSHAMTIMGFNDSIRYDYNGDGQYTNHIDINGDGIVDMRDWEIGGIKMCNTYSGGPSWANNGYCYIMYKAIAGNGSVGAFWKYLVNVMEVNPNYQPQLTAKASITYTNRKRIKVVAGMSLNTSTTYPEYILDFPIFDYQGGDRYMTGGTSESDKTIEFGLDLTPFLNFINENQQAKFFIIVTERDDDYWGSGTINSFSVINYSSGIPVETVSTNPPQNIPNNGIAMMSVILTPSHSKPQIIGDDYLMSPIGSYFSTQLNADGGNPPYEWSFDNDFDVSESIETFPSGGTTISATGFTPVSLGFNFKYYGKNYNTVYVKNNGLVVFQSNFSEDLPYNYNNEPIIFIHNLCIAPFYIYSQTSTVKTLSGSNYKTIIWENNKINFAMTLFNDGRIKFQYKNANLTPQDRYVCGVSAGDEKIFQYFHFNDLSNVPDGFTYTLTPKTIPEEFNLTSSGILSGTPTTQYTNLPIPIKVTDNNGIHNRKTLYFITDGLILSPTITTPNNSIIEYNETVNVNMAITNPMSNTCTGINITMTSNDPYISIIDGSNTAPNIPTDGNVNLNNAFSFHVAANIPNNHNFQLNFTVTSYQGTWNYNFTYTAYAPNLFLGQVSIIDGNDNIATAGENIQLTVPILNSGGCPVNNVLVSASSNSPYLSFTSNNFNITAIAQNSSQNATFNISISNNIPSTTVEPFTLNITADNNFQTQLNNSLTINMPELQIISMFINDGNDNCLYPNETADIIFNIKNQGLISATNITAALVSNDPKITINTAPQSINILNAGTNTMLTFNITASSSCNLNDVFNLILHVNADYGYTQDIPVILVIGILEENFETGDLSAFQWINGGNLPWVISSQNPYEGAYCLKSGAITHNQMSVLQIELNVVADGEISFARKVDSEAYYDFLEFLIDDVVVANWSGNLNWAIHTIPVTAGQHTFTWRYRKDGSISSGADAAWIDKIIFPAYNNLPPMLWCETQNISKTMLPDDTDTDELIIQNIGGGEVNFTIEVIPQQGGKKNIAGSTLTTNIESFLPGQTLDVQFFANCVSPDLEWIKRVVINFSEEICINSSTNMVGPSGTLFSNNSTGCGTTLEWNAPGQWGEIRENETGVATVNLSFDPDFTDDFSIINYTIYGDIYGSEPHTVSSSIILPNPSAFWLRAVPSTGSIPYLNSQSIDLIYDTHGLEPGIYYADLKISDPSTILIIPVELIVDQNISTNNDFLSNSQIYPNPFNDVFTIYVTENINDKYSLFVYDITGKTLLKIKDLVTQNSGNKFVVKEMSSFKEGLYLLELRSDKCSNFFKVVKN